MNDNKQKILIVDDEEMNLTILSEFCKKLDMRLCLQKMDRRLLSRP